MNLSDHESAPPDDRFARQSSLVNLEPLRNAIVTVIGVGAVGRQVALQLAAFGVPRMQLVDFDHVELTNVTTQAYRMDDIGKDKVTVTAADVSQIDPGIEVIPVVGKYKRSLEIGQYVFMCVDNMEAREFIWQNVQQTANFVVDARMTGEVLRVLAMDSPAIDSYYETTLFSDDEAYQGSCTARGTIYTACITAGFMVQQLSKHLRGIAVDRDVIINLLACDLIPV